MEFLLVTCFLAGSVFIACCGVGVLLANYLED